MRSLGAWRSLVAHSAGGRAVAGSNPVAPITRSLLSKRPRGGYGTRRGSAERRVVPAVVPDAFWAPRSKMGWTARASGPARLALGPADIALGVPCLLINSDVGVPLSGRTIRSDDRRNAPRTAEARHRLDDRRGLPGDVRALRALGVSGGARHRRSPRGGRTTSSPSQRAAGSAAGRRSGTPGRSTGRSAGTPSTEQVKTTGSSALRSASRAT